jgi:pyroglutamyl-peptidase
MTLTVLLTGFGPFPGAPDNPTGPLVQQLAQVRGPALADVRLVPHVFPTSYRAVDEQLPRLLAEIKPDALLMFGLSERATCLRVETRARNVLSALADAAGELPPGTCILPGGPEALPFGAKGRKLALAARAAGIEAMTSRDAGSYLCNYISWRAIEAAVRPGGPRFTDFVHVPQVGAGGKAKRAARKVWSREYLARGSEAILLTAIAETRKRSHMAER